MKNIISSLSFLLLVEVIFSAQVTRDGVLFLYEDANASEVFLVGSMNDWNTVATPMIKTDGGIWEIVLPLEPGKYTYKFIADGSWHFDQNNSRFEDDGYGGSNSLIEIDQSGQLITEFDGPSHGGVNSGFNPKVYFKGRYFSKNEFSQDQSNRYMLETPYHDLNFGIKVKFNPRFEGYTILNVNNQNEGTDIYQTHFKYKRSYLLFNTDYFKIRAFDNFGFISFNNPLNIVGGEGYNDYDFGYGFSGVYVETSNLFSEKILGSLPIELNAQGFSSDRNGENEDDVSAYRLDISNHGTSSKFTVGVSSYKYTHSPYADFIQNHDNHEIDLSYKKYFSGPSWKGDMRLEIFAEYSSYENSDLEAEKTIWMDGENIFFGVSLKLPSALDVYAHSLSSSFKLGSHFSRDKFFFGFNFNPGKFQWNVDAEHWTHNSYDLSWRDYYKYVERTDANGRFNQIYSEVPFEKYTVLGYGTGFLWNSNFNYNFQLNKHQAIISLKSRFAHHDLLVEPKFAENILVFKYDITKSWAFKVDSRIPYYNDPYKNLKTSFSDDIDVFISTYYELIYHLSNSTWMSIGYGVNPLVINTITDKFYDRGREEYLNSIGNLSAVLESSDDNLGEMIREAEVSLMNQKNICIQAVIEF